MEVASSLRFAAASGKALQLSTTETVDMLWLNYERRVYWWKVRVVARRAARRRAARRGAVRCGVAWRTAALALFLLAPRQRVCSSPRVNSS